MKEVVMHQSQFSSPDSDRHLKSGSVPILSTSRIPVLSLSPHLKSVYLTAQNSRTNFNVGKMRIGVAVCIYYIAHSN